MVQKLRELLSFCWILYINVINFKTDCFYLQNSVLPQLSKYQLYCSSLNPINMHAKSIYEKNIDIMCSKFCSYFLIKGSENSNFSILLHNQTKYE